MGLVRVLLMSQGVDEGLGETWKETKPDVYQFKKVSKALHLEVIIYKQ